VDAARAEEFVGRLFMASLGAFEVMTVYVGGKLGLYQSLRDDGPASPGELAARTHIAERYAQEFLEQQAAAGIITVDDASKPAMERRYTLPEEHAEPLLDRDSPFSIEPLVRFIGPMTAALPQLLNAYRTGGGLSWDAFGTEATEAQGDFNRPWLLSDLGSSYLPSIPDIHERLAAGARVADVACGVGWASIALAKAYPEVTVDGFDLDEYSITLARKNAAETGVADRVSFEARDAADPANAGKYDFAIIVEALHDMSNPVGALKAVEKMLKDDGVALIVDERVADVFTAPADETDRFMYAVSLLVCLPAGMADTPSAGTGTVIRSSTLTRYANEAGFSRVTVLDQIEHPFLRFYRLER
jgi:2-polyprenyl-3-methyl-5-hydroxy-6-metoxy-1,4-benzoquinol methylase